MPNFQICGWKSELSRRLQYLLKMDKYVTDLYHFDKWQVFHKNTQTATSKVVNLPNLLFH